MDRPVADHLRQAFAQVTNPAIDPERERIVMDLRVELGRRPALLGGPPREPSTTPLARPIVADLDGLLAALRERLEGERPSPRRTRIATLDATWPELFDVSTLDAASTPFQRAVLALPGVASLFGVNDFVTVTRVPGADWEPIVAGVIAAASEHL